MLVSHVFAIGKTTKYRTVVVKKCQKLWFHAREQSSFFPLGFQQEKNLVGYTMFILGCPISLSEHFPSLFVDSFLFLSYYRITLSLLVV
jgi:hypothetical protein